MVTEACIVYSALSCMCVFLIGLYCVCLRGLDVLVYEHAQLLVALPLTT